MAKVKNDQLTRVQRHILRGDFEKKKVVINSITDRSSMYR